MREKEIFPDGKNSFKNPGKITLDERDSLLWINGVFGVNKEGQLPARFLSGFLSTFGLAEIIQKETKDRVQAHVRIFIPQNISAAVNEIDPSVLQDQIAKGTRLIEEMAKIHFPTVQVFFEKDEPFTQSSLETLGNIADLFINGIDEASLGKIRESGRKRGGEQGEKNALIYSAHHSFGWSDLHSGAIFKQQPPFTVINTLPPSEKPFTTVRRVIRERIAESEHVNMICEGKRFDLSIMMCDRPHYLLITDPTGTILEPTVDDLSSTSSGEILDLLRKKSEEEQSPWIKENLRKARIDFEKLLKKLYRKDSLPPSEIPFQQLLKGEI